jgi:uncharacterized membrane protein YagU involved in acid resistance
MHISKVLKSGFLVGTLDITAALLNFYIKTGKDPQLVLKYIASAVFGKEEAYGSGSIMSVYGLLFHYIIAFFFTIFFFLVYPKLKFLSYNKVLTGIGYGIFIWAVMQYLVLPLSKIGSTYPDLKSAIIAMSILIFCIGLPLSFIAGSKQSKQ